VPQAHPTISTHVLDTAGGHPAAGIQVRCWRLDGSAAEGPGGVTETAGGVTDEDGRIADLLGGLALMPGRYRLAFDLGRGRFFEAVTVDVMVEDATRSHHVPLLLAPYGLTTYRGS
jgi:5-hydroxyisourate hydrolase